MARDRSSRPEAKPVRLFVAIDVPPAVRSELDRAIAPYRESIEDAKWTRPDGWHVTLKFLGQTWPRLLPIVTNAVDQVARAARAFDSSVTMVGAFPSRRRARVLWAGLADPEGQIVALAADLDRRLQKQFRAEKRPFTPHLTLARMRAPVNLEASAADVFRAELPSTQFAVDGLVLYRSLLSPRGASYEAVRRVPFGR